MSGNWRMSTPLYMKELTLREVVAAGVLPVSQAVRLHRVITAPPPPGGWPDVPKELLARVDRRRVREKQA